MKIDFSMAWNTGAKILNEVISLLANVILGIAILILFFISVTGIEGNVSDIQARATVVMTKDGREVIIPNAVFFTSPVAVGHQGTQKF